MLPVLRCWGGDEAADTLELVRAEEVRSAAAVLVDPAYGVQLQGLPSAQWRTCNGDDLEAIVQAAQEVAVNNRGVYFTLNPCPRGLASPMASRFAVARRWLLLDCDVTREQGQKDVNSTDAEHEAACEVAYRIYEDMGDANWPLPVMIDSGNGWHLLYRIDLPNDDDARVLLRNAIKALAERFDTPQVHIDRAVHDARRISKLPGTLTRKGPATPERPHRWARLVFVPQQLEIVTAEQLKEVAGRLQDQGIERPILQFHSDPAPSPDAKQHYARRALEGEIAKLRLVPVGMRNNSLNVAALKMGHYVGAGALLRQEVESALLQTALAIGLDERETLRTIRSGLEKGISQPKDLSGIGQQNGRPGTPPQPGPAGAQQQQQQQQQQSRGPATPTIYTLHELAQMSFPPPKWAVEGLLSEGITILAGKPKLGKSWLALNLALTIAEGGQALGGARVAQGDVLYLSLEDRLRRVQDRARKVMAGLQLPPSKHLHLAIAWPKQDQGGSGELIAWLKQVDNPRLVIIDVWSKFRVASTGRRNAYDEDYEAIGALKAILDEHNCSCVLVHHCKKGKAEDVIEEVSGTLGLGGAADGITVLARARGEYEAILHVTGRDVEDKQLAVTFDPQTFCWSNQGDAKIVLAGKTEKRILDLFLKTPRATYWPSEIAEMLEMTKENARQTCHRMADRKLLRRVGNGAYSWPVEEADCPFTEEEIRRAP